MSHTLIIILAISFLGLILLAFFRARATKNWRQLGLRLFALLFCATAIFAVLATPGLSPEQLIPPPDALLEKEPAPRGEDDDAPAQSVDGGEDIYFVIVLYGFMLIGMLAQYGYHRFENPKTMREAFDAGRFLAPIFASPIIFVPLLAALQSANLDLSKLDAPRLMLFFVAFENGFFWKDYFDQRRKNIAKGENDDKKNS